MRKANHLLRFLLTAVLAMSLLVTPIVSAYAETSEGTPSDVLSVSDSTPAADEPVADEPVADEPVADEPVADEPAADEPVADEPAADEPVADEPAADESVADEPVADEPAADEPVADEPAADEDGADAEETGLRMHGYAAAEPQAGTPVNLALNKGADAFKLEMEGAGTDKDPGTKDITIREKEEQSLPRLTDGFYGTGSILDGNWNGTGMRSKYYEAYRNIDRVITLDLGQVSHIQTLSFHMQEGVPWGISAPSVVTYYLSEDGVTFHRVGRVTRFDAQKDTDPAHITDILDPKQDNKKVGECLSYYFKLADLNYNARYVKLTFELTGTWAFADELEVWGTAEASADAAALPDTPGTENEVVNHYATTSQSKGIQHEGLAYAGHYISNNTVLKTSEKTVEQLLPMVGYVDKDGKVTDTFFNSVTFLSHGYTPNKENPEDTKNFYHHLIYDSSKMANMEDPAYICATKDDWQTYLDFLFDYTDSTGAKYNLDALEEAVAQVKAATNKADYTVGVKVAFYPPILCQDDWGTLPGGDHSLNFKVSATNTAEQARADRIAASKWYLDEVVSRFAAKNYKNIRLDGFYWYDEVMHYDVDPLVLETVTDVTSYVHSLNGGAYQIYWIPFYQASGFRAWKSFGFDYAIMQPNYAFDANASEQRILDTAELCKKYGLGIEMEFGGISDKYITQFRQYLTNGADDKLGYQNNSLIAWYTGTWGIHETSQDKEETRYIYDAMHDFYTGKATTMAKPNKNLAANGKLTLEVARVLNEEANTAIKAGLPKLVDGDQKSAVWADGSYIQINRNNQVAGPFVLTADLEGIGQVNRVALDFIGRTGWGIGVPDEVTYSVSQDGASWTTLGTVAYADAEKTTESNGFDVVDYVLTLESAVKARYIRATFDHGLDPSKEPDSDTPRYSFIGVDEFTVNGTAPVASGEGIAPLGTVTLESENIIAGQEAAFADRQTVAGVLLNNGTLQTGSWNKVNTVEGDYVGILQGVAAGPYTVQIAFDTVAEAETYGLDFMTWESSGIGAPDEVTYYTSLDGENWTKTATVTKADAKYYPAIATGINGYHYVVENDQPLETKYLKAVFTRGYNPDKDALWGWIAFDEFTVTGTLTSKQPQLPFDKTEGETNVQVEAAAGVVPVGTQLVVEPVAKEDEAFAPVADAFAGENVELAVFDISLLMNGLEIQPNGTLIVTFPLPAGFDAAKTKLYRVEEDGTKTLIATALTDGKLKAELDHLSLYVLAQEKAAEDPGSSSSSGSGSASGSGTTSGSGSASGSGSGTTSAPNVSSTPNASTGGGAPAPTAPQTSDPFPVAGLLVIALLCGGALTALIWKKHREQQG